MRTGGEELAKTGGGKLLDGCPFEPSTYIHPLEETGGCRASCSLCARFWFVGETLNELLRLTGVGYHDTERQRITIAPAMNDTINQARFSMTRYRYYGSELFLSV